METNHLINHPSIILIIGRRRYGKSALGHYILEKFNLERNIPCYIVSFPKEKQHLLPSFITPVDNVNELPENCVALVDEGSLKYHAHLWQQKETVVVDRMMSVSGQKKQTIIFVTHTMRKFAVNLVLEIDLLLCKAPSLFHSKLERSEVRKLIQEVYNEFRKLPKDQIKKSVYVISDGFQGFIRNPLPSYWNEEISEAFAGIEINQQEEQEDIGCTMYPQRIEGGLKIWFRERDLDHILEIIPISKEGIFYTGGKAHIDFDLKQYADDKYILCSNRFDMKKILSQLRRRNIRFVLDTKSGLVDDEFYPIEEEQLQFQIEEKQKTDKLKNHAEEIKL